MSFHWQETSFDFYCLQIKLSRLVLYPRHTDGNCFCFHEQCFVFAFLKVTKLPMPVPPGFVHFPMVSSTPLARERGRKLCHSLLGLPAKIIPEAGRGLRQLCGPRWRARLAHYAFASLRQTGVSNSDFVAWVLLHTTDCLCNV